MTAKTTAKAHATLATRAELDRAFAQGRELFLRHGAGARPGPAKGQIGLALLDGFNDAHFDAKAKALDEARAYSDMLRREADSDRAWAERLHARAA